MTPEKWLCTDSVPLEDHRIFRVRRDRCVSPRTGGEHDFVVLESADWVVVVATTRKDELVMVRQYRHGLGAVTLEIPGGLVDPGLSPVEGARHELRQETGYGGGEWQLLGSLAPVPSVFNNHLHVFLGRGVELEGELEQDPLEDIAVELYPFAEIRDMVARGAIDHAQVVGALYLYELWLGLRT